MDYAQPKLFRKDQVHEEASDNRAQRACHLLIPNMLVSCTVTHLHGSKKLTGINVTLDSVLAFAHNSPSLY
jgi:hypothetical protein